MGNCACWPKVVINNVVDNVVVDNAVDIMDIVNNHMLYFYGKDKINMSYNTLNGLLHGEDLLFDRNGNLLSKAHYKNGVLHGIKTDYNISMFMNGELVKIKKYEQLYENGVEISTKIIK